MSETKPELIAEHLTPRELIENNIDVIRDENIPVTHIRVEATLIDESHVASLKGSIKDKRGQISPITVRARLENGEIVYDIIDGFHRTNALKAMERETGRPVYAHARVMYACNDEELYDLRVLAVSSVASVKFARMAEWMQQSFFNTQWNNPFLAQAIHKGRLSLYQAFSLTGQDSSGRNLGLDYDQVAELKKWVEDKARKWDKSVGSLTQELRVVEMADPQLIKQVRKGGGGSNGKGALTFARLKGITEAFPNQFDMQRQMTAAVIEHNITADEIPDMAAEIKQLGDIPILNGHQVEVPTTVEIVAEKYSKERKKTVLIGKRAGKYDQTSKPQDSKADRAGLDYEQLDILLRGALESLLNETLDRVEEDAVPLVHGQIARLRKLIGADALEEKLAADSQKKLILLADFETPLPLKDELGRQHTLDFKNRRILCLDGKTIELDKHEACILALRIIYRSRVTNEMLRAELFGEDSMENEYLDDIVKIVESGLKRKLKQMYR